MSRSPRYLACLVALGASSSACAESGKIEPAALISTLHGECYASGGGLFSLLQLHAQKQESSQSHEPDAVAWARPSSSRDGNNFAQEEGLIQESEAFYLGDHAQLESECRQIDANEGPQQCGCYHGEEQLTARPSKTPPVYMSWTMWKPEPSETVFTGFRKHYGLEFLFRDAALKGMLPGIAYNPALLPLPKDLAKSWHPDAHYVAVARHFFGVGECDARTARADFQWTGSGYSSVMLLNKNLETLVVGKLPVPIEDYRLFAYKGKVLLTANVRDDNADSKEVWSYRVFELGLKFHQQHHHHHALPQCPGFLEVEMNRFKHLGVSDWDTENYYARFFGKNIGLFKNKKEDGELQLLWRLTNPVSIRNWTSKTSLYTQPYSTALRNNGNPIYLPEHDAYLAIGHMFWQGQLRVNEQTYDGVRHYLHRIVMFDANPPYKWLRASKPLCFPTMSELSQDLEHSTREEWCEGIQFIMSWFREGDDILLTYGVNDCEPGLARVPLQAILEATSTKFAEHPEFPKDGHAERIGGEWD